MKLPKKLQQKINTRKETNTLRSITTSNNLIDFSSNDYLGFAKNEAIFNNSHFSLVKNNLKINGATGSRLLSGNHTLYDVVEKQISEFHNSEKAIIFNSGYDANIGFFSSVPQRGDIVLYDEYIHASIRDGIKLSNAKAYKFNHNCIANLERLIIRFSENSNTDIYVVTESVFSMDGDSPNLKEMVSLCKNHNIRIIIDEAHALGVFKNGLTEKLNLQNDVFARIVTFGKALGCHGAAILCNIDLKEYLINFSRSFIYTTALSPHSLATIKCAYEELSISNSTEKLHNNIQYFKSEIERLNLNFIDSNSAIHCCIISGNDKVKNISQKLKVNGFDVKPILSPTVPLNQERLRFCLHSYNSNQEITAILEQLATFV